MFGMFEDDIPKMLSSEPSPLNIVIKSEEEYLEYRLLLIFTLREIILKLVFTLLQLKDYFDSGKSLNR